MSGSQKVQSAHLKRLAIVYLRQSSPRQVRENFRSTERQYALAGKAAQLGWEPARVLTVDADLGISGRGTHAREAYKELVGRVCLGEVGAIFGLEVARLARNNAELLRLLEFCAVTDTLVVDTDGIYDLKDFNDRTILGLKAQWSEAELHIMGSRLQGAKRHAAERGELRLPLPIGYLYDDDGDVILDPDEEVQAAVADLFKAFAQTGSAYGVVGVFTDRATTFGSNPRGSDRSRRSATPGTAHTSGISINPATYRYRNNGRRPATRCRAPGTVRRGH